MTTPQILFIGGIHGVGKTTVAEKLAVDLGVQRFSAGDLIRGQLRMANQGKAVLDVDENQDVLVVAVRTRVTGPAILDGHFCLIRASLDVRPVPMRTFVELAPVGLLLVTCEISEVARDAASSRRKPSRGQGLPVRCPTYRFSDEPSHSRRLAAEPGTFRGRRSHKCTPANR